MTTRTEEGDFLAEKATPRAEQRRSAWGYLLVSLQTSKGLCSITSKCVRRDGHEGMCWPNG